MSLQFFDSSHTYALDGKAVPGVTTLIGGGVPKPALPNWAARTVAEYVADNGDEITALLARGDRNATVRFLKGLPWKKRDAAAVTGSAVHALAEQVLHGHEVQMPQELAPMVEGYVRFIDAFGVLPVLTEVPVANRTWWYAGKLDAIAEMEDGPWKGETILLDWKTSNAVYGETALQCAAYAEAEFYMGEDGQEHPLPPVDRIAVVHIQPGQSNLYDLGDRRKAFAEFKSAAYIAKTAERRKSLIGEPVPYPAQVAA